jgi:hypothetical protein
MNHTWAGGSGWHIVRPANRFLFNAEPFDKNSNCFGHMETNPWLNILIKIAYPVPPTQIMTNDLLSRQRTSAHQAHSISRQQTRADCAVLISQVEEEKIFEGIIVMH